MEAVSTTTTCNAGKPQWPSKYSSRPNQIDWDGPARPRPGPAIAVDQAGPPPSAATRSAPPRRRREPRGLRPCFFLRSLPTSSLRRLLLLLLLLTNDGGGRAVLARRGARRRLDLRRGGRSLVVGWAGTWAWIGASGTRGFTCPRFCAGIVMVR